MSYPKIARLVNVLKTQTENGSLNWSQTEQSDTFQASFPNYSVRVFARNSNPIEQDYVVQIINHLGDIVEEVADPDLKAFMESPYKVMRDLHDSARRSAMGVENALDDILNWLTQPK